MLHLLVRLLLKLLYRVTVEGRPPESAPERLLIVANHVSLLDPVLLEAHLPYRPIWVVHTDVVRYWYFRLVSRLISYVVVDPTKPHAVKALVREIESGRPVGIFPEGRITVTGGLMKVYDSPAFLAARTGAAILPVHISGAEYTPFSRMKPPFPRNWFPRIRLTVFPIEKIEMPEAAGGRERRRIATRRLRDLMVDIGFRSRSRGTLYEAFLDAVRLYGRRTKILDDINRRGHTYGGLLKAALALGRLTSRIAAESETVGVLMPNAFPTVALLLGMFAARRIPAMMNYTAGVEGMQSACATAGIETVVTSRVFLERARLVEKAAQLRNVRLIYLEDLRPQFGVRDKLWLLSYALRFPRAAARPARPEEPAIVLFTSGSEGKPKGVVLSHDSILANVAQVKAVIDFTSRDKLLSALPLFHSFGLTAGVFVPLLSGAGILLYPSPLHFRIIPEMAYGYDCTALLGTPVFLAHYGRAANPYDFYQVRLVIAGAEKLSDEVRGLWQEKFGIRILEGYGVTECSPVLAVNTPFEHKAGTVGRLLPGIEGRVEAVEGIEQGGELRVRGPNVMLGYLKSDKPGAIERPVQGWYATGDVVEIDREGFVRITGRLKRFAKVAGEMVSLELAERIAAAASRQASAATTQSKTDRGELIVLFTENPALRRDDLIAAARKLGLPELAVARRIEVVDKLPVLASGKFDYVKLKSMAEALSRESR
ncbi:MAG: bifunctional acyl-ACP--phospholipid O-acyltransferase/long-chain-fatty-acid--ACP ligase [Bryobacteraceae bacterium]|nr:bifunctional acyl-ACP--phospholipid O-acyltransferase/long-chain-fatty-acid--ACP ligase [Bryobacteraceae bacterium]